MWNKITAKIRRQNHTTAIHSTSNFCGVSHRFYLVWTDGSQRKAFRNIRTIALARILADLVENQGGQINMLGLENDVDPKSPYEEDEWIQE